ncbi:MAG: TRAP transporter large permease [Rhodospirillales bacterium]|nr:TRAP transporter large permease [Rhodospirillales bacterium]
MSWVAALILLMGLLFLLGVIGLPIAFVFFSVNIVGGAVFLGGGAGLVQMIRNSFDAVANFSLAPIPLFILMGEVLFHTGVAFKAITAIERIIHRMPGRLSVVAVISGTLFSALSGSTIANTALLGSSLMPEMLKRNYHPSMAMGPIMAVGGIAMLIPPSALAVLLGSLSGISIAKLLIGGIVPGLMMSGAFIAYILIRCALDPKLAPIDEGPKEQGWARWRPFVVNVLPLSAIIFLVIGCMVLGWATPTEAAGLGSVASVIAAAAYGALTRQNLMRSLTETAKISVMILFIIAASVTFSQILAFSGAVNGLLDQLGGLKSSPFLLVGVMVLILVVLGCLVDQVSMIMLTLPFFMPLAKATGIDEIWLGVLMLISMELGLLTPPFGMLLFVMQGVMPKNFDLGHVYRAALPFVGLEALVLAILFLFPKLAVWLPSIMTN